MEFIEFLKLIKSHHVIGIVGEIGDGKSIVGVALINILYNISLRTQEHKTVLSNVPLGFNHEFLVYYEQLNDIMNALLFVDEIHLIADSRMSHNENNFFTSKITVAVRKRKNQMIWTSQESSQVELRVRNRTTLFIDTYQVGELIFKLTLVSKNRRVLGEIILNLSAWKDDYDTYYIPLPLIEQDEENDPPDNSDIEYVQPPRRKIKKAEPSIQSVMVADELSSDKIAPKVYTDPETGCDNVVLYKKKNKKVKV